MDKERAKFILESFRPDGADADDHDFAEALELAVRERDLGEWLARERAFDSAFSKALATVELPTGLREGILGCLAEVHPEQPVHFDDPVDGSIAGALGSLQPPMELRDRILVAMERTALDERRQAAWWKRFGLPLAAAAGIALAFVLTRGPNEEPTRIAAARPVPMDVLQAGFMRTYEAPGFRLDLKREQTGELVDFLRSRELPCPGCLPEGLRNLPGIGCRELVIGGKRGSLICFDTRTQGVVHLVIFQRKDVAGDVPPPDSPGYAEWDGWASASWADGDRAFVLLGHTTAENLAGML